MENFNPDNYFLEQNGILVPKKNILIPRSINEQIDVERAKEKFIFYSNFYIQLIKSKYLKLTDDIAIKQQHSLTMGNVVSDSSAKSGVFNESYILSAFIDGLLHDIGRFRQYYLTGNLKDLDAQEITGYLNHGEYGAHLLEKNNYELLRYLIGDVKEYYHIITEVVRNHTKISNIKYNKKMEDLINIFPNYSLDEVINSSDEEIINMLIALKIIMVVEEDNLELLYNVRDGKWKPAISSEHAKFAHPEVMQSYFEQKRIMIPEFQKAGTWACNDGFLFRYGLIYQNIKFRSSLQSIVDKDVINKVFEMQYNNVKDSEGNLVTDDSLKDPTMLFARDYTSFIANKLLEVSVGNKIITDEMKKIVLEMAQKEFGPRYQDLLQERKTLVR